MLGAVMLNGSGKKRENSWERVKSCRWSQSKNAAGIVEITADGMQWTSLKQHGLLLVLTLLTGTPHWFRASEEQNAITTNSAALPSHQTYPAGCQSRPSKFCAEPEPSMSYLFSNRPSGLTFSMSTDHCQQGCHWVTIQNCKCVTI